MSSAPGGLSMPRVVPASALLFALALAAGCGKKPAPDPEATVAPDPKPRPDPKPDPKPTPADPALTEREAKAEAVNRLRQVGLALHNVESAHGFLPAGVVGPKGELGLSWRVAILPYLGDDEAKLYEQFKLDQAWDSEANKKLLDQMPKVFASPAKAAPAGKTHVRSFAGFLAFIPAGPYNPKGKTFSPWANRPAGTLAPGRNIVGIHDGSSNTLMAAEAAEPVEWTRPDDLPFRDLAPANLPGVKDLPPVPKLGSVFPGGFHALMCDGSVRFFPDTLSETTLRALISVSGGEVLGPDAADILNPPRPDEPKVPADVPADLPDAAARKTAVANYRAVLQGLYDHHDTVGYFPAGVVAKGAVGLSWRVQLLPFLGEEALYKEFKLGEPWDSEHNKKLIPKVPKVFASPGKAAPEGHTFVRTTEGGGGIVWTSGDGPQPPRTDLPGTPVRGRSLASFHDGTSNTILFVEAAEAVPWTKPGDLPLPLKAAVDPTPGSYLPKLGGVFSDGFHAAMADGRVTFYKTGYPAKDLVFLLGAADGQVADPLGQPGKIGYSLPLPPAPPKNPKAGEVKPKTK
ncbi:MAG: hypothetical protein C0501_01180 [Isosphaera sp.]|nr:hypothetical protein [Isosphaera sp.]